jgi:HAAS domain-containing protein
MSTTTGLPPNVAEYLDALRAELSDLAPEERDDLLSEVEPSLLDAAADDDEPIAARLGPAADFAADLRASAGLPPAPRATTPTQRAGLRTALRELAAQPAVTRTASVLRELAPVWWIARAYVAVAALALLTGQGASDIAEWARFTEIPRLGSPAVGLLVLALATVASIAAGIAARRHPARHRGVLLAVNAVLVIAAVPVAGDLIDAEELQFPAGTYYSAVSQAPPEQPGLHYNGVALDNVYAYDRAGRLLFDVRLYDSQGRPLDWGANYANPDRRPVRDADGNPVLNAFPIRYFVPGTNDIADPMAAPPLAPPRLTTPPPVAPTERP